MPQTPHVLRHTFPTLAIQMAAIQKILGHDPAPYYGDLSQFMCSGIPSPR